MSEQKKWISLFVFLFVVFTIEFLGGILTETSVHTWYLELKKPNFNPPGWVFGPVWTVLYAMIAVSGWKVFCIPRSSQKMRSLSVFAIQLVLNLLWSFFFFFLQNPLLALIDILFLLIFIAWTFFLFRSLSRLAGFLLVPYFLWTLYATVLNLSIVLLNRGG